MLALQTVKVFFWAEPDALGTGSHGDNRVLDREYFPSSKDDETIRVQFDLRISAAFFSSTVSFKFA